MAIDSSASQVATNALQSLPFGSIIGAPLKACVEAQAEAAETTWRFIQEVGLQTDENGNTRAVTVQLEYVQGGRRMMLNIPLLTIVPIPYLAIHEIDIAFKAQISASSSSTSEQSQSSAFDAGVGGEFGYRGAFVNAKVNFHANYSSKKDSKATQESKYSVEYTMDVHVRAGQESMPAGMARMLEILNSSVDVTNAKGEISLSDNILYLPKGGGKASLVVTYKNSEALYDPYGVKIYEVAPKGGAQENLLLEFSADKKASLTSTSGVEMRITDSGDSVVCSFDRKGNYYLKAGKDGECRALVVVQQADK